MSVDSDDFFSRFNKEIKKKWTDFKFSSHSEYLMITFACSFTVANIYKFKARPDDLNYPNIVQYAVGYLIVGLPITYMQIVMSQYSQLGVMIFKNICPLSNGIGYAMIITSFFWCCFFGMNLGDMILYLLICMESNLYWSECPAKSEDRCWDINSPCTDSCISEKIQMSSYVYWNETFMNNVDLSQMYLVVGKPIVARLVTMIIGWIICYSILTTGIDTYKKLMRLSCYVIFIFVGIILMVCGLHEGGLNGMILLFTTIQGDSFFSYVSWIKALNNVLQCLSSARVCHILYGTYLEPNSPADLLAILTVLINFLVGFASSLIVHSAIGIIMHASKTSSKDLKYIWNNGTSAGLVVIPEGLGLLGVPQLWNAIYFLTCVLILVNNLVSQIDAIQRAIIDAHPKIITYRYYMMATLCVVSGAYGFLFSSKEAFPGLAETYRSIYQIEKLLNFLAAIIIFWVYGVQRISDDIHFLKGSQPPKYWKIMWFINPIILGLCLITVSFGTTSEEHGYLSQSFLQLFIYLGLISPIPILTIYELFHFLKMHKIVSIMQPEERWGPPDPDERHLRRLFNPREEIRSRRRDNTCPHSCLVEDIFKDQVVHEEDILRRTSETQRDTKLTVEMRQSFPRGLFSSATEFTDNENY